MRDETQQHVILVVPVSHMPSVFNCDRIKKAQSEVDDVGLGVVCCVRTCVQQTRMCPTNQPHRSAIRTRERYAPTSIASQWRCVRRFPWTY